MKNCFRLVLLILTLISASIASAAIGAQGTISWTQNGSNYNYDISLKNTGTVTIGVFWFSWVPGENYMSVAPTNFQAPAGWSYDFTSHEGGASDGYGIHWSGSLAAGATLAGFKFTSTMTPTQMLGNSAPHPGVPVGTSFVYATDFSSSLQFVVKGAAATPAVSGVSLTSSAIAGGNPVSGTVTISPAAGASGTAVTLSSSNTTAATVPASVSVASGATTAPFTVTTKGVDSSTSVTISATGGGATKTTTLTVNSASLASVTGAPPIQGGATGAGKVVLNGAAGPSGKTVTLASDNTAAATVPASVKVAANTKEAPFTITSKAVNGDTVVHISATLSGVTKSVSVTVLTAKLSSLLISSKVYGGTSPNVLIYLNGKAGPTGKAVSLSSSNTSVLTTPATGSVGAAHTSGAAVLKTFPVSATTAVTITGSMAGVTKTTSTSVVIAQLNSMKLSPPKIVGGDVGTGAVYLIGTTATDRTVSLSSNNAAITPPATMIVKANTNTGSFPFQSHVVSASTMVTISAKLGTITKSLAIEVLPLPKLVSLLAKSTMITGSESTVCTVTLNEAAGKSGAIVQLSTDSASISVPPSVKVPYGATTATFTATGHEPNTSMDVVTVTGTLNGSTASTQITVEPS